jgi:DNA-directed RNA polymerase subunit RPC12/RpoP
MNEYDAVAAGEQCPDCGSTDTESNGSTEYRCVECDHRWGTDCNERYGYAIEDHDMNPRPSRRLKEPLMKFVKTDFGWNAYARCNGSGYVYIGHFYTQRDARAALNNA